MYHNRSALFDLPNVMLICSKGILKDSVSLVQGGDVMCSSD